MFASIDPGMKGGVALVNDEGYLFDVHDLPVAAGAIDVWALKSLVYGHFVTLERAETRPGLAVNSVLTTGINYGVIVGALTAWECGFQEVRPSVWMKKAGVPPKLSTRDRKEWISQRVCQLMPHMRDMVVGSRGGVQDGRSDAALLGLTTYAHGGRW